MFLALAAAHARKQQLLVIMDGSPTPSSAFTTFTSADYTPDADGTTSTTLTFTVKDASDVAIEGQGVTYA